MGSITPQLQARPGIMVVHPRLHDVTPENEETFLRWTKLHDRDLFGLRSAEGSGGKVLRTLRFGNGLEESVDEGQSRLLYTVHTDDIALYKTPEYYAISRRLDIENTRSLHDGEVAVGCQEGQMVWDIVDARFAIYEQVQLSKEDEDATEKETASSFHELPARLTSKLGAKPLSSLIGFGLPSSTSLERVADLQSQFVKFFTSHAPPGFDVYSSLYRNAGPDAQPDMHPTIESEAVGGGEWLVLVLIVDERGEMLRVDHVRGVVGKWSGGVGEEGMKYGVWGGEMFMS